MTTTTIDELNRLSPEKKRALLEQMLREKSSPPADIPLSSGQQRLWFLDRLEPGSPLYNISIALRLRGQLNAPALSDSLNEIIRRHEALRTTFPSVDGSPTQRISPPRTLPLELIDLSLVAGESRDVEARRRIREAASQPFDLTGDLMLRAWLLRLDAEEHILVLVAHHIASDEWSLRVLFKELALLYEARMTGTHLTLPELPIQYADYSIWQRDHLQSDAMQEHLAYWRNQLEGCHPNLELPSDTGKASEDHRGEVAHYYLSTEDFAAVKDLARRENATHFMTLLAAFYVLLHRYTRQEDILIGSPIAGRTRAETEELIGFFVNTLPLRARLRDDMTFRELLAQVRETTLGAYANQDLPFEKLVETLHPDRGASGSPLVQVMFALNTDFVEEQLLPGLRVEAIDVENGTAKFDLTLVAQEERGGLKLGAEYDSGLLTKSAVERLLGHYSNLLQSLVQQPEAPLASHDFLSAAERKRLLIEWNDTRRTYPRNASVSQLFEEWSARTPAAPALAYGGVKLNYSQLNARANQVAHRLRRSGLKRGDLVGLLMDRSPEMVAAMLGVLKAGAAYVPLDPGYPPDRLAFMLQDTAARFVIAHEHVVKALPALGAEIILLNKSFASVASESDQNLPVESGGLNLAYIIYTSGSTGVPKGVSVTHRGIIRLLRNTDYVDIQPSDVIGQSSSASFDASTFEIWGALLNGAQMVGITKDELLDPAVYRDKLNAGNVTVVFLTTALFNQLANEVPGIFEKLRYAFFGGEASDPKAVASVLRDRPPQFLMHVYGPTETTVYATAHRVREVPSGAETIPIGRPIANGTAYVLDSARNLAPIGVPGELYLGGDGVALDYFKRPELTAEKFVPDPFSNETDAKLYRSGDLVRLREDGEIEFVGRIDNQVKIRGFRIELGEIETALLKHPSVRNATVLARQDTPGEKRLVAYIEFLPNQKNDSSELKSFLTQSLPEFMVPAAFVAMDRMPLNANGKVDRKALPAPEWSSVERVFEAPGDPLEQQIAKIWEHVLGVQPIGATDNFFDLGGHSLLAVKLFAQFEKVFAQKLPLATLFKAPTIRGLAAILRGESKPQAWSTIVDIQPRGAKRPIFWVHSLGGDGGGGFFYYRRLAELLGEDQPSFGIRSPQEPFDKIESMADYYIRALRDVQPQGPYLLGGFCFGGVVAFEMARQLEARGEKVALLAVLESGPPNLDKVRHLSAEATRFSIENVVENLRDFVSHRPSEQVEMVKRKARKVREKLVRRNGENGNQPPAALKDLIDMTKYPKDYVRYAETHWKALESYKPGLYNGPISLFRARKQPLRSFDPSLGWNSVAPGRVKITVIPGTHESIVQDPNVQILAAKIQEAIRAALPAA